MSFPYSKILVTGAGGFLGQHTCEALAEQTDAEVIPVGRADYDLLEPGAAEAALGDHRPDAVIHLAGKIGGIIANRDYPADFFYENLTINTRMLHASWQAGVDKFLTFIGGCSYPAKAVSPIGEDQMWNGYPQGESAPYSTAKKMMLVQADAYRRQHGFNAVVLIPGNVYGEYDNFNWEYAHVIPALIRRFIEAREAGAESVACYGSGRPTRDFVYARDVARLVPWFLEHYDSSEPVNISSGTRTSIRELAETVQQVTGFQGRIDWDPTQPDGQIDKIFRVDRLHELGLDCPTLLEEGLQKTSTWFETAAQADNIRI